MFKIVSKEQFSEKVFRFRVEAPLIAKAYRAGNFVIIRIGDYMIFKQGMLATFTENGSTIIVEICDIEEKNGQIGKLRDLNSQYLKNSHNKPRIFDLNKIFEKYNIISLSFVSRFMLSFSFLEKS